MQRNVTVASTLNETLKDNTCEEDTYALSEWDMVYQTTQSYSQVETFWGCTQQMNPNTWAYYNTLMGEWRWHLGVLPLLSFMISYLV